MITFGIVLGFVALSVAAPGINRRLCDNTLCAEIWQPVCGTDSKTYSSPCKLSVANCKDPSVTMLHHGECGGNPFFNPNHGRRDMDKCSYMCMTQWDPICGSDGKTYSNMCYLKRDNCVTGLNVTVAKKGAC